MRTMWREASSFPRAVRLLFINQFSINAGFYMLMPYLADYLAHDVHLAAWAIGLVLGIRNLGQQGMFFLGGALADRFGYKPLIVSGLLLRTVAFGLLAIASTLPILLVACALIGFAGALFNPAVRAYVAQESGDRRVSAFAMFNMFYQAGLLAGPLIGLALLAANFQLVCAVSAGLFALLSIVQAFVLPAAHRAAGNAEAPPEQMRTGLALAARNRRFLTFSLTMSITTLLIFQTYLVLPLQLRAATSEASAGVWTAVLFGVSGLVAICAQRPLTTWARKRLAARQALTTGLTIAGLAFAPLALASAVGHAAAIVATVLVAGAALGVASALTYPFEMDTIVTLAADRFVATHYGVYSTITGLLVSALNLVVGATMDLAMAWHAAMLPAIFLTGLGIAGGVALHRMRHLDGPDDPAARLEPVLAKTS